MQKMECKNKINKRKEEDRLSNKNKIINNNLQITMEIIGKKNVNSAKIKKMEMTKISWKKLTKILIKLDNVENAVFPI